MKKSTTMRSLLLCGLSLLLCVSMLAGTTFAWFTDSVESGRNQIVAGNLDVELYNGLDNTANKVTSNTELFEMALWEPGAMVYENLTVANEGTLELKYQLGVNVTNATTNANGDTLAKVLKVAVVDGGIAAGTTREALQALTTYTSLASFVESGKLAANGTKTYGIVIWWEPSDIDNQFNMNNENKGTEMSLDIGVKLFATQAVADTEKDSFDETYDEDAWMDGMQVLTADDLQSAINSGETAIILMDDIVVDEPIEIPAAAASTYSLRNAGVVINLNGKTLTADLQSEGRHHYAINNYGIVTITGKGTINARGIQNFGTMVVDGDITITDIDTNGGAAIWNEGTLTINNGTFKAVASDSTGGAALINKGGNVTVNGGVFEAYAKLTYAVLSQHGGKLTINNATVTGVHGCVAGNNTNDSVITVNGGNFTLLDNPGVSDHCLYMVNAVYGGNFKAESLDNGGQIFYSSSVAEGYCAVLEADGSYNVLPGENTEFVENGLYKDGNTYYVTNADGLLALSSKSETYFSGKTIKLANDIDCTDVAMKKIYIWDPENPTTFDGCGYTIYNLDISTASNSSNQGLIHGTVNVKNLTVDGAWVEGYGYVGVIASTLYGNIENCHVKNAQVFAGYWQAGIMVGQFNGTSIKDCSVVDSEIYAPAAVAAIAGIFTDNHNPDIKFENCVVENCAINQTYSFGADYDVLFGAILGLGNVDGKNYIFNNCVVENTTIRGEVSDILCGEANQIWIDGVPVANTAD